MLCIGWSNKRFSESKCNSEKKNTVGFSLRLATLVPAPPLLGTHKTLNFSEP
jgi:hypothetical protein